MTSAGGRDYQLDVTYPAIGAEGPLDGVALVAFRRPGARNALSAALISDLATTLEGLDGDGTCRAVVLTGDERVFASGADVRELVAATPAALVGGRHLRAWDRIAAVGIPVIAAVRGYALGGGCELAMACDLVVAGEDAQFGQPEIRLGVIPGAGGTQRLPRLVGRARALELVLTGRAMSAREAQAAGLVNQVVPTEATVAAALELARQIAAMPPLAVRAAKTAIRQAWELPLGAGLTVERQLFALLFTTQDQREGMTAFLEKRPPRWQGR